MSTETHRWVEGWSMPQGAYRYHYYVSEQVKLCNDRQPAYWNRNGTRHLQPILSDPEFTQRIFESDGEPCAECASIMEKLRSRPQPDPDPEPIANGFTLTPSRGQTRIELECRHQHGLIYVTEGAEANFVCSNRRRPAHSLAGFFLELGQLQDNRVKNLMQRWGLYYRSLPLEVDDNDDAKAGPVDGIPVRAGTGQQADGHGPERESAH